MRRELAESFAVAGRDKRQSRLGMIRTHHV